MTYLKSLISGRLGRVNFVLASLLKIALLLLLSYLAASLGFSDEVLWQKILAWVVFAALWYFGFSINLRRFYDINANKTLSVILSILMGSPFAGVGILSIIMAFIKGTNGPNRYGEENKAGFIEAVFKVKEIK